jgi:anti-anti-sigma regulatory factor/PAS domain-containing protein
MTIEERLAGIHLLQQPIWVFDSERGRMVWANRAAVELWRASSCEELLQRDFSEMSPATRTRNQSCLVSLREGRTVREEWTWYPMGTPVTVQCHFSGIELDDGRLAMLVQGVVKDDSADPTLLRGIEALRHTSAMVALVDRSGRILMQNPAVLRAFGPLEQFHSWFVDASVAATILREVSAEHVQEAEVAMRTSAGQRWHAIEARSAIDPATGESAILIHQMDVTERRESEQVIESQRRQILSLAAPILGVGRSALALPIIGALDRERSATIAATLLGAIVERRARDVILDLTGADTVDAATAEHLVALVRAVRLLGARPILTGIQPALALTFVGAAVDLAGVLLLRDLHQALDACRG